MITHGDFMLTLFSFALFLFLIFLVCVLYIQLYHISHIMYIKCWCLFYDFHLYKASNVSFQSCFTFLQNYQHLLFLFSRSKGNTQPTN